MSRVWLSLCVVCGVLCVSTVCVAVTCYQWRYGAQAGAWSETPAEAAAAAVAFCTPAYTSTGSLKSGCAFNDASHTHCTDSGSGGDIPSLGAVTSAGFIVHWVRRTEPYCSGATEWDTEVNAYSYRTHPVGCPECPATGTKRSSVIEGDAAAGDSVCGSDGCAYKIGSPLRTLVMRGGMGQVATVESKGMPCGSDTGYAVDHPPVGDNTECVDGSGNIGCLDSDAPPPQGCGYFNGDYVCTGHVPDGSCVSFESGGVACTTGSADAPADSGAEPVEPDGTVAGGDGEVDYFAPDTVGGASTAPTTVDGVGGSATGSPGSSSDSSGSGDSGGDTIINCPEGETCVEVDLEGECPEGETCDGSLPNAGEFGAVCTFGECATSFYNRVTVSPLLSSVTGAGAAFPSGACPNWTLEAFESDYSLSGPMCDIWEDVSPVLSAVFLVIWGWVATRVVLSA